MKGSETHAVCNKHNIGGKSVCCACTDKTDCPNEVTRNQAGTEWEGQIQDVLKSTADFPIVKNQARKIIDVIKIILASHEARMVEKLEAEKYPMLGIDQNGTELYKSGTGEMQWNHAMDTAIAIIKGEDK